MRLYLITLIFGAEPLGEGLGTCDLTLKSNFELKNVSIVYTTLIAYGLVRAFFFFHFYRMTNSGRKQIRTVPVKHTEDGTFC
jgi:hypothetical protein